MRAGCYNLVHNTRGARLAELAPELEAARIAQPEKHLRVQEKAQCEMANLLGFQICR
jgi:hypothetical protein